MLFSCEVRSDEGVHPAGEFLNAAQMPMSMSLQ